MPLNAFPPVIALSASPDRDAATLPAALSGEA